MANGLAGLNAAIFCPACKHLDCRCPPKPGWEVAQGRWQRVAPPAPFVPHTAAARDAWLRRLTPVVLVLEHRRVAAAMSGKALSLAQLRVLYGMLPPEAHAQPALAARWEQAQVIASPEWAKAQLGRVPMLPPKGERVCFV